MMRKCVYCNTGLLDERVIEICDSCGVGVWGEKMFRSILDKNREEKLKGNLDFQDPSLLTPY